MPAPFFFSYAHNDTSDGHVDTFYDEVSRRVRFLTGRKEDGFRDVEKLRAGDEWSAELAAELCVSPAMVSLYSPSYFASTACAQEMQVFLERRARYRKLNVGKRPCSIIPVLWQPCDRIPWSLPDFQYERPVSKEFAADGVWRLLDKKQDDEFKDLAQRVAVRVKEALKVKLPEPGYRVVFGGVGSAFLPAPLPPAEFDAGGLAGGPECATFVYVNSAAWHQWPFGPEDCPALHVGVAVARGRDLEARQLTFAPGAGDLVERLARARGLNNLVMLLVDGMSLGDAALRQQLQKVDAGGLDALGTIVVWPPGQDAAQRSASLQAAFPILSAKGPPFFAGAVETADQLAQSVAVGLDSLQMSVLKNPQGVPPAGPPTEFTTVPGVEGPGAPRKVA
jgi:hypothetical protein